MKEFSLNFEHLTEDQMEKVIEDVYGELYSADWKENPGEMLQIFDTMLQGVVKGYEVVCMDDGSDTYHFTIKKKSTASKVEMAFTKWKRIDEKQGKENAKNEAVVTKRFKELKKELKKMMKTETLNKCKAWIKTKEGFQEKLTKVLTD